MLTDFTCLNCGKECRKDARQYRLKYCSNACQKAHENEPKYMAWLAGSRPKMSATVLRRYVVRRGPYQCAECGCADWNGAPLTLEVDHINGDSNDSTPLNVRLLCPNCHSQTPTFRAGNLGNGRHFRRERIAAGLSY